MTEIDRFRPVQPGLRSNPDRRRAGNETEIESAESFSVVLLGPDLPEIDTSQARGRARRSRRRDFGDDAMNGSAAIADDKGVVDDPVGGSSRDIWNIQIDLLAPGAVGIYRVTAGLARSKVERAGRSQPIAGVIDLRKTSFAVKSPDADDDIQGGNERTENA